MSMVLVLSLGLNGDGSAASGCAKYSTIVNRAIAAYTSSVRGAEDCAVRLDAKGDLDKDGQLDLVVGFTVEGACYDDKEDKPGACGNHYETFLLAFSGAKQLTNDPLQIGGKDLQLPESITIAGGIIQVDAMKYAKGDPSCCPSLKARDIYRLSGRTLVAATPGAQQAPPPASANQHTATKASSLVVEGTLVNYQPVPEVRPNTVAFQTETKGYRNIYLLDCLERKYYWAKNIELRTQQETTNTAGAEWKMMSEKSTITNAVYQASCPQLLGSKPAESAPSASANPQFELEFWSSVKNSDDLADFQAYLDKYPQGQFEALARRRIDRLKEAVPVKPTATPMTESVSFDQFLHGVDDQCRYGESLDNFWKNLMTVDNNGNPKLTELIAREYVPIEIRQAMGNAAFTEKNEQYFAINVPISGTWRGLHVEALKFIIGNESGWHSLAVIFQSPPQQGRFLVPSATPVSEQTHWAG